MYREKRTKDKKYKIEEESSGKNGEIRKKRKEKQKWKKESYWN